LGLRWGENFTAKATGVFTFPSFAMVFTGAGGGTERAFGVYVLVSLAAPLADKGMNRSVLGLLMPPCIAAFI
jgi:uncharacterized membrane protein